MNLTMNNPFSELGHAMAQEYAEFAGWLSAAAAAAVVGWHKLRRSNSADNKVTEQNDSITTVINMLRSEIDRLSAQNSKLAGAVNALQLEVIALREENATLLQGWKDSK